jgi:hypothetical protein
MSTANDIFSEPMDWLFWPPILPRTDSAWLGHVPFAYWIVGVHKPRQIVELGTLSGSSYASFCDSAVRHGVTTKAFAVDTWEGDAHTGSYGAEIYKQLREFNALRFGGFSTLLRKTFDEALADVEDGSVDLLHIDGLHTFDAVKHDFETWLPKLSDRAIVLFHDTAERKGDFGVWQLWDELSKRYPSFAFDHWHGLGVLQVGSAASGKVLDLFALESDTEKQIVRDRFEALGNNVRNIAYAARMQAEAKKLSAMLNAARG